MGHNLRVQSTGITTTRKPKALRVQYCRHPALFPLSFSDDSEFRLFTTTEATTNKKRESEKKKEVCHGEDTHAWLLLRVQLYKRGRYFEGYEARADER